MTHPNWTVVSESPFPWEADAIAFLRERLPNREGFHGWSNLEFVAQDGSVNEVDTLLLTPRGVLVIEIKSHPGRVEGDLAQWTWTSPEGRRKVIDNPLPLANTKAKRLKGLLGATKALKGRRVPWVEAAVFLGNKEARSALTGPAGTRVYARGGLQPELAIGTYLEQLGTDPQGDQLSASDLRALRKALEELNLRRIQREFRVGQYQLAELLDDAEIYQDHVGRHRLDGHTRRIRLYPWPATGPETGRKSRRRAAEREFALLDRSNLHPGVLRAHGLEETERGVALIFEHPNGAERLDAFLTRRGPALDLRQRLRLLRDVAEVLAWAHGAGLYHRALTPYAVLVTNPDSDAPGIKLFNWQVGIVEERITNETRLSWHDFLQVGLGGREANAIYLAPEVRAGGQHDPALLDVFSLGVLAYQLVTLTAPAATVEELLARLREERGLHLVAAIDGVPPDLDAAVQLATSPDLGERPDVQGFLDELNKVLGSLAAATDDTGQWVHPLDAERGAELEGGFRVERRLGSGSTAVALHVERDGREGVLKVAREAELNERLRAEGEILRRLRHQHVVELYDVVEVSGHVALFIELAGQQTMAQRIRQEGALSLDLLQRFGEELLSVVDWLEQQGIPHRDLKPDNIGIGETRTRKLTLKLFDFSLSSTPADNIRSGTPGYLDPFLVDRRPARWDAAAERYAVAVTLHEMATGMLPHWGDGRQHPATLPGDAQPVLASERFDAALRDGLTSFFMRALARDPKRRFDTAEAMRKAWHDLFSTIDQPQSTTSTDGATLDASAALATADADTPLAVLGLTPRVLNGLERLGATTVGQLADLPRGRLYINAGIGLSTLREIRTYAELAARTLSERSVHDGVSANRGFDLAPPPIPDPVDAARTEPEVMSVDLLQRRLIGQKLPQPDQRVLRQLSGLESPVDAEGPDVWPSQRDVAEGTGLQRAQVAEVAERARVRWAKERAMTVLRDDLARMLDQQGGVATREELAQMLLTERGSSAPGEAERLMRASAVIWCALEMEAARETSCRFRLQRGDRVLVIVTTGDDTEDITRAPGAVRQWVEALGECADRLIGEAPLVSMTVALEELENVPRPQWLAAPAALRLLRLAMHASREVALTSRGELYRRGLAPELAVRLGAGGLLGVQSLTIDQLEQRLRARFPQMAPLPPRPTLDRLLGEAGLPLVWQDDSRAYRAVTPRSAATSGTSTQAPTQLLTSVAGAEPDPRAEAVHDFEQRIAAVLRDGRFLALVAAPQRVQAVARALAHRHGLARVSLEAVTLEALRAEAAARGVAWPVVVAADREPPDSRAHRNLRMLVAHARPRIAATLEAITLPTLLEHAGLLARYDLLGLLGPLQDHGRRGAGIVLLIPGDGQSTLPVIDGVPLPVVHVSDWAHVPSGWLHRASRAA